MGFFRFSSLNELKYFFNEVQYILKDSCRSFIISLIKYVILLRSEKVEACFMQMMLALCSFLGSTLVYACGEILNF